MVIVRVLLLLAFIIRGGQLAQTRNHKCCKLHQRDNIHVSEETENAQVDAK